MIFFKTKDSNPVGLFRNAVRGLSILIGLLFAFACHVACAQDTSWEYSQLELRPGTQLSYEAYSVVSPLSPRVREDFTITIRDLWPNGVTFLYALEQKVIGAEQGMQTLSSLDDCASIDPWWEPMSVDFDNRCELWISKKAFRELKGIGKAWLSVDTLVRNDSTVRWEMPVSVQFPCKVNGVPRLLRALRVKTNRGDDVIVLDDPQNPLILAIESAYFAWKLLSVATVQP